MNEVPCITFLAVYILSINIIQTNSRSSTLWKLSVEDEKIIEASCASNAASSRNSLPFDDPIFNIITSTVHQGQSWTKSGDNDCPLCNPSNSSSKVRSQTSRSATNPSEKKRPKDITPDLSSETLDCGRPANFTFYDNLVGVANRMNHPNVPEPQVMLIFKKKVSEIDISSLERKLKKAKREKPKSVQLYNQIGNFWRVRGDTLKSIECFRRALAVSPHNAEVLLNLARVLFNLQYLDDAIYLTRRSLEVQPPDKNAWQQYFTLGEIFKAYGHYQEAALHLRHCLELKPEFEPAALALLEMQNIPDTTIHVYTLLIIVCLVLGVLLVIVSSVDGDLNSDFTDMKTSHRHFNRALAMRSLKFGISARTLRATKRTC
ncbi:unnamed protein product [Bemisia tabaci]|uniref:Tetratricopeptide repeat protein 17 n=1 Tax=Bemisia tabaci TaxID=7038 RepID=A0A9P0EY29_BEMTA|nr:PREDICTED: uncharacterized protein LOC109032824 [Bemisia tabaci]CAH0384003.1 unnamed protein product [Bemisia tabaci]